MTINHIHTTHADARHIIHLILCMAAGESAIRKERSE